MPNMPAIIESIQLASAQSSSPELDQALIAEGEKQLIALEGVRLFDLPDPPTAFDLAIDVLRMQIAGIGVEAAAHVIDWLCRLLSAKRPDADTARLYAKVLAEIPPDLLDRGIRHCLSRHTYHTLPTPGQLVAPILSDLEGRRSRLKRLERRREDCRAATRARARTAPAGSRA